MAKGFSNQNQTSGDAAYRFGEFELYPNERLLKQHGHPVKLQPKAFDALLCLVRKAERLVTKQELASTLWPSVHVGDASLTNAIVSLRKVFGRDSIRTVSKYGYRFVLPVTGEPGMQRETYERFARAKELTVQRSVESMRVARDLYYTCIAENPGFAAAWAWLGRCCWFLAKFSKCEQQSLELADAAFRRAFLLDPELACAHQFYTVVQVDMGRSEEALIRLMQRIASHPTEPESFAGLVQILRYRGLLEESVDAHRRAIDLDRTIVTGVAHTLFLAGDYAAAIQAYSGRGAYYLDAAAWAALGQKKRAIALLHERLNTPSLSPVMSALMSSLLALLEGEKDQAASLMAHLDINCEPEILFYLARHYAKLGLVDAAAKTLEQAMRSGFLYAPQTLNADPWLSGLRKHRAFGALKKAAERRVQQARSSFEQLRRFERRNQPRRENPN